MQRNPHSYQIATGYRTFYSLSLIYQPIKKKRLFFFKKYSYVVSVTVIYSIFLHIYLVICQLFQMSLSLFYSENLSYTSVSMSN